MKYTISNHEFSFGVIATILTGYVFAQQELSDFARLIARDSLGQVMADRKQKWVPWLLVQFPFLLQTEFIGLRDEADARTWFDHHNSNYGKGPFTVRAVHPEY